MIRYSFHVSAQHLDALQELAQQTHMTVSDHLRRAIERYLVQPDQRTYLPFVSGALQLSIRS